MPKLQKSANPLNLEQFRVWVVDSEPASRYFRLTQLPDTLTGGKNAFLINGCPELDPHTEVLVEVKDANGNVVFSQPIRNYVEGLARVVSIEVYVDTAPGLGTITLLGVLRKNEKGQSPPPEFDNRYNVRWQRKVAIAPYRVNTTPIRLYQRPTITVSEFLSPYRDSFPGMSASLSGGLATFVGRSSTISVSGALLNRDMEKGVFSTVVDGQPFSASVLSVLNDSSARLSRAPTGSNGLARVNYATSDYRVAYQTATTFVSTSLSRSFADITISKLTTFSGDIARTKIYMQSLDQPGEYALITDIPLEAFDLTVTQSLRVGDQNLQTGYIYSQSIITEFWTAGRMQNGRQYGSTVGISASRDTAELLDSIYISNPASAFFTGSSAPQYYMGLRKPLACFSGLEYTFAANAVCVKSDPTITARMDVYLIGESFPSSSADPLGVRIASYTVPAGQDRRTFSDIALNILAERDGVSYLRFVIYGGGWYISDVTFKSARETGFNPDEIRIVTPVTGRRFERLQFKAEFFDANSNILPVVIESEPFYFNGGNLLVRGDDNRIDGIITVAPSGSGPLLTSRGFYNKSGSFTAGQAIAIGPQIPYVRNKNTAFFAGTSSAGPEISVGDKLYGYYDSASNQFILEIDGTIRVGSGSSFTDIRSLVPGNPSFRVFQFLTGSALDFWDVRGINSVNAGRWYDQIARMGNYTRGYNAFTSASTLDLTPSVVTFNPYTAPTQSVTVYASGTITIPSDHLFWNQALYGSSSLQISNLNLQNSGSYALQYSVDVFTKWGSYPTANDPSQILLADSIYYASISGSMPSIQLEDYPIFVPPNRTGNTLYVMLKAFVISYPST